MSYTAGSATVTETRASVGDSLLLSGGLLLTIGAGVAAAWLYGALAAIAAALLMAGLLTFLVGVAASRAGR